MICTYINTAVHCKCQILFYGQNHAGEVSKFNWGLCLWFVLLHIFLAYLEGPQNKKNSKFIVARSQKSGAPRYRAVGGQTHAGEVSNLKFRSLSLICAVLHLFSICGRSSKQKKLEIYWRQKKKKRRNKIQGCRGQNGAGEVSKFKFRSLSLICAVIHFSSISGRSWTQKTRNLLKAEEKKAAQQNTGL